MNNMNRRQLILGGLAATVIVVLPRQSNADMTIGGYIIVASLFGALNDFMSHKRMLRQQENDFLKSLEFKQREFEFTNLLMAQQELAYRYNEAEPAKGKINDNFDGCGTTFGIKDGRPYVERNGKGSQDMQYNAGELSLMRAAWDEYGTIPVPETSSYQALWDGTTKEKNLIYNSGYDANQYKILGAREFNAARNPRGNPNMRVVAAAHTSNKALAFFPEFA
jgi:hypothetical protein